MNKTQCPHCFTVYVISDEQLQASQGMVRCGTCRERFEAQLLNLDGAPKIDLSHAFIEPLSEAAQNTVRVTDFFEETPSFSFKQMSDQSFDQYTAAFSANDFSLDANLNSELSIEIEDDVAEQMDPSEIEELEKAIQQELKTPQKNQSNEIAIDAEHAAEKSHELDINESNSKQHSSDQLLLDKLRFDELSLAELSLDSSRENSLIDEVDALLEKKILSTHPQQMKGDLSARGETAPNSLEIQGDSTQELEQSNRESSIQSIGESIGENSSEDSLFKPRASRWVLLARSAWAIALLACLAVLLGALIYQLWLKQLISWPDRPAIQEKITPVVEIAKQQLDASEVSIPTRRNLSQLELVSARTEAHPTRPTTLLLRVSLINHAHITQPLPWLELSLTDADGRLVSRRNFSPENYIFNNRIDSNVGARQLKRITIELLAFPEQVTGYEVKLLNK